MGFQDSCDSGLRLQCLLSEGEFEPYIELTDGYIKFDRLKDDATQVLVNASLYNPHTSRYEAVLAVMPYREYLGFFNSLNSESDRQSIKASLEKYIAAET